MEILKSLRYTTSKACFRSIENAFRFYSSQVFLLVFRSHGVGSTAEIEHEQVSIAKNEWKSIYDFIDFD